VWRVQSGNTSDRVGYCLDVCDLFLSKAAAGRDRTVSSAWHCFNTAT